MRGWILLALLIAGIYYFGGYTHYLDEPKAKLTALVSSISQKLNASTGTQIIRVNQTQSKVRASINERLSHSELQEFQRLHASSEEFAVFKAKYCEGKSLSHPVFSKDNLLFICDNF